MAYIGVKASGQITSSSQIENDLITTNHIAAGTIGEVDISTDIVNKYLGGGNVINYESKSGGNTSSQTITPTWSDSEKGAVTYTVVSPTSKIYVQWNCHFQVENDASNYRMLGSLRSSVDSYAANLSENTNGTAPLAINYSSPAIYLWIQYVQPVTAFHAHGQPAGTTISYKMYFQGSGSVAVYSWDTWGAAPSESVTFMEVEQ